MGPNVISSTQLFLADHLQHIHSHRLWFPTWGAVQSVRCKRDRLSLLSLRRRARVIVHSVFIWLSNALTPLAPHRHHQTWHLNLSWLVAVTQPWWSSTFQPSVKPGRSLQTPDPWHLSICLLTQFRLQGWRREGMWLCVHAVCRHDGSAAFTFNRVNDGGP